MLEGQVPRSFGCRGELHGQRVVKIPFGLSWNQDGLEWLYIYFSFNLLYCPALLVQLTWLGLTAAIVALIDLSYRFVTCMLALRVSWGAAWTSLFPLDCLYFAVPYTTNKCSNALPNKTAASMEGWKLKFVWEQGILCSHFNQKVGVENPQILNRLRAAPGQDQYNIYLEHQ